jgi:hypothetical protein
MIRAHLATLGIDEHVPRGPDGDDSLNDDSESSDSDADPGPAEDDDDDDDEDDDGNGDDDDDDDDVIAEEEVEVEEDEDDVDEDKVNALVQMALQSLFPSAPGRAVPRLQSNPVRQPGISPIDRSRRRRRRRRVHH